MDTREPRTPTGGNRRGFFDDAPVLSTVKVPSDPAQVIVNHASFRVHLATPMPRGRVPVAPAAAAGAAGVTGAGDAVVGRLATLRGAVPVRRRKRPVVWSGRIEPGDTSAVRLLQAVRRASSSGDEANAATQVLPRIEPHSLPAGAATAAPALEGGEPTVLVPTIVAPRGPRPPERPLLGGARPAEGAPDNAGTHEYRGIWDGRDFDEEFGDSFGDDGAWEEERRHRDAARQGYYPGRGMNLGVVLLPLRIFLGLISVYAGMGKLCDPVYFDGGDRGSLVGWLRSLQPWGIAEPLRDFAVAHPVGAGLTVAFLQIVIGVLTILGLWQRAAAGIGVLLSAALLVTVSWRSVPAYDAPDIIYLAAWSPLAIAGAPYYSLDAHLAGEAWRRLGPHASLWDLRRRVLRRGAVVATVLAGLTLLVGSVLGGAVRSARVATVPEPGDPLTNNLPGSPLPDSSGAPWDGATRGEGTDTPAGGVPATPSPSGSGTAPASPRADSTVGSGAPGSPSQDQTVRMPQQPEAPAPRVPDSPVASSGADGGTDGGGADGGGSEGGDGSGGGSEGGDEGGGTLGGLLG